METDIREVLPAISVPTLMLYHAALGRRLRLHGRAHPARRGGRAGRARREHLGRSACARCRSERFLAEGRVDTAPERVLTTVLFTDIVESTSRAAELGDRRWRELLEAHHAAFRAQLARYGGKEIRSTGDGFFATFEGPARAIACAHRAVAAVGGARARHPRRRPHRRGGDCRAARSRASRCTSARASRPRPGRARCSSRASSGTSPPARASTSRTAA